MTEEYQRWEERPTHYTRMNSLVSSLALTGFKRRNLACLGKILASVMCSSARKSGWQTLATVGGSEVSSGRQLGPPCSRQAYRLG